MQGTGVLGHIEWFLLNANSTAINRVRLESLPWCRMAMDEGMKGQAKGVQPAWILTNGHQVRRYIDANAWQLD